MNKNAKKTATLSFFFGVVLALVSHGGALGSGFSGGGSATSFPLLAPNGTSAAPSYSWSAETTLGFYRSGAGVTVHTGGVLSNPGAGANSERFGKSSTAASTNGVAIGNTAAAGPAGQSNNTVVGAFASTVTDANNTTVGAGSTAGGGGSGNAAYGAFATATGGNSSALGEGSICDSQQGSAVGAGAQARTGLSNTAIGAFCFVTSPAGNATGIGNGCTVSGGNTLVMGANSTASGTNSIALGYGTTANTNNSICLGYRATTTGTNQLVVGSSALAVTDIYFGKGVSDTAATDFTIHGVTATGAGNAGGNVIVQAGASGAGGTRGTFVVKGQAGNTRFTVGTATISLTPTTDVEIVPVTSHSAPSGWPIRRVVGNATLSATADYLLVIDATGGNAVVALPAIDATNTGRRFVVKKIDSSANTVTVTRAGGDTIDGGTTYVLSAQYQTVTILPDLTNTIWYVE